MNPGKVVNAQCTTGVVYAISSANQQTLVRLDTTTDVGTTIVTNIFGGGAAATMAAAGGQAGTSAAALDLTTNILWFANRGNATDPVPKIFSYNISGNTYGTTNATFSGVTTASNFNKAAYNPVDRNIYFHNSSTNTLYRFNPNTPAVAAVSLGTLTVPGVASPGGFSGGDIAFDGLGNLTGAFNNANILAIFPAQYDANGNYNGLSLAGQSFAPLSSSPSSVAFLSSGNYIVGSTSGSFKVSTNTGASTDISSTNNYSSSDFASCAAPAPSITAINTATRNCAGVLFHLP
ncbi:NHL repeat-containing protein [Niabella hibiscisoli]|uniref:hypothetical protein n=1 Tax=Niabella hibiscisoli TaxID=1825928 RepID=UPI001F0E1C91|nr:hypothetical protein [Niabella hibiscisoli]MCH5719292.1 hypothetical protein [Niabella hibiscisoli]